VIPSFTSAGLLPQGIHEASWLEVVEHLGGSSRRKHLLRGLLAGLRALRSAGCEVAYIDGSFVTAKLEPGDIDVCYESDSMNFRLLDPVLKDFSNRRTAQKQKYGSEFFEAEAEAVPDGTLYLDFFQLTKDGKRKGIISLRLSELPEEVSHD
jgi:hypothetical protein